MSQQPMASKPKLSFWQIWNVSFGFLGVQFGFALQNANVSRILSDLGADLHSLSLFWLVAPIMGLLIQPIVGSASDRTWNKFGRRNPYILIGALTATFGMFLMPNSPTVVAFIAPMIFGAMMLAVMDASFNIAFQPFRALVADMVPEEQMNQGYSIQSLLINIGAVIGSILPFVLTNVVGLSNESTSSEIAPSVVWAFYIGATVMLGSVLWTVFKTKEYEPERYYAFKGLNAEDVAKEHAEQKSLGLKLVGFWGLMKTMPFIMKRLALVQFFSWFALFIMWVYTMPAIAQQVWGIDVKWFDPVYIESVGGTPDHIADAKGAAGDWVGILFAAYSLFAAFFSMFLAKLANTFGRKLVYGMSLLAGGLGYLSFMFIGGGEPIQVNLLITEVVVPEGAVTLLYPMIGIGIAWSAILAMPYTILAGSLPASKTGVYMGIFNFTIAAPQIVSGIFAGWILSSVFDNQAMNIIVLAGVSMVLGAISVIFVKNQQAVEPTETAVSAS